MMQNENKSMSEMIEIIKKATETIADDPDFWDSKEFEGIKKEIKQYLKKKFHERCAYCQRSLTGEHNITIDIEHILEKDKFPRLTFEIDNLAISCRRCNFKKNHFKDVLTSSQPEAEYRTSYTYRFIHPHLDNYFDYISLAQVAINGNHFLKYLPLPKVGIPTPAKAWFTYELFSLRELERFDLCKKMKICKPNIILAIENEKVRDYLAEQFQKSHDLRKQKKLEKRMAQKIK